MVRVRVQLQGTSGTILNCGRKHENTTTNHDKGGNEKRKRQWQRLHRIDTHTTTATGTTWRLRWRKKIENGIWNDDDRRWRCGDYWKVSDRVPHTHNHNNKPHRGEDEKHEEGGSKKMRQANGRQNKRNIVIVAILRRQNNKYVMEQIIVMVVVVINKKTAAGKWRRRWRRQTKMMTDGQGTSTTSSSTSAMMTSTIISSYLRVFFKLQSVDTVLRAVMNSPFPIHFIDNG